MSGDILHLANKEKYQIIIKGNGPPSGSMGSGDGWVPFEVPRGARMAHFLVCGSGAGGGAGYAAESGTGKGGGGGGGSSGLGRLTIPTFMIPKTLYAQIPGKRAGGTTGNGEAGLFGIISMAPTNSVSTWWILRSNAAVPGAGAVGTAVAGGAAGSAGTIPAAVAFSQGGTFVGIAGGAGGAGGAPSSAGSNVNALNGLLVSGGAGGGSVTTGNSETNGGRQSSSGPMLETIFGGVAPGGSGFPGIDQYFAPLFSCGGVGGAGNSAGIGGAGSDGGWGSGGGGGGGGTTGGYGGMGGPGLMIATFW